MYILWVIAKPVAAGASLATALVGNHAVRLFASTTSFISLARLSGQVLPDGVVVDLDDHASGGEALAAAIGRLAPGVPVVMVTSWPTSAAAAAAVAAGAFVVARCDDAMQLEVAVTAPLAQQRQTKGRRVVRFRDLVLDLDALRLQRGGHEVSEELPLKEAQILRMLLERPGTCLSRQEIKDALWQSVVVTPRTIDSHVSRLRKRLASTAVCIESVYGDGYVLR